MRQCIHHPEGQRYANGNCVACHRAAVKASRAKKPEKYAAYHKAWAANNRDKVNAAHRAWYEANPERAKAIKKAWRERHPERRAAHRRQYQAQKEQAVPTWADKGAILTIYEEARKLTIETGIAHHVDHIVPIKHRLVCGLHVPANLRAIRAKENRKKSNSSWPDDWDTT